MIIVVRTFNLEFFDGSGVFSKSFRKFGYLFVPSELIFQNAIKTFSAKILCAISIECGYSCCNLYQLKHLDPIFKFFCHALSLDSET